MTFDAGAIEARLILNRQQFQQELSAARAEGADFEKDVFTARADIDNRDALASIKEIQDAWNILRADFQRDNVIDLNNAAANAKIAETELLFQQLRDSLQENINVKPNLDLRNLDKLSSTSFLSDQNISIDVSTPGADQSAQTLNNVARAANNVTNSTTGFGYGVGLLNREITLWGGLFGSVHMLGMIQLWHILLDSVIETTAAVTESAVALTETGFVAAPGLKDIYTRLKSIDDVSNALGQDIPPVTGHLQQMGQTFSSLDTEALGGILNLMGQGGNNMLNVAEKVGTGVDDVIAKLDLWNDSQKHTGQLAQDGADVLSQLAHIAGEVFLSFDNLVKADPGTVHFLLDVVEGASDLLRIISKIPTPILETALAIHSFVLWGGLITSWGSKILGPLSPINFLLSDTAKKFLGIGPAATTAADTAAIPLLDLRSSMANTNVEAGRLSKTWDGLTGLLATPGAWAIGAAAIGYITYQMLQADRQAKSFVADLTSGLSTADASQAIDDINTSIGSLNQEIKNFPTQQNNAIAASVNNAYSQAGAALKGTVDMHNSFGTQVLDVGKAVGHSLQGLFNQITGAYHQAQIGPSIDLFHGTITNLTQDQQNLFHEIGKLTSQGYTYSQSLALMDDANVRAGDSFAVMEQKVKNLIKGWQDMSVTGGILDNGVNAITLSSELQQDPITQLTAGWDAFMKLVSGAPTAFVAFEQSVASVDSNVKLTGASMSGLNANSLTLRSSWESSLSSAGAYYDALAQQASAAGLGAQGTALLTQAGKDLIAQLIPQAKYSQQAQDQLYAFAQIAGYDGPNSLAKLTSWLGNTGHAAKNLDNITTELSGDSAGLLTDVENLANAINQTLNQAMAAAIFQADGGQSSFDNFANALHKAHDVMTAQVIVAAEQLGNQLISVLGNTQQAENEFITFATQLGVTRTEAQKLWYELSLIKPISESINVQGSGQWSVSEISGTTQKAVTGAARGMFVTTGAGPMVDDNVIAVAKGEAVVPADLVPKYASSFASDGIPGFQHGGIVGSYTGNWPGLGGWALNNYEASANTIAQGVAKAVSDSLRSQQQTITSGMLSGSAAVAQQWAQANMGAFGWPASQYWPYLDDLWTRESGWNPYAVNPSSGAYGIPQSLGHGHPYNLGDYVAQILWGFNYIAGTYGNPYNADMHELAFHWYDDGGAVKPGAQLVMNGTGRDEYMLNPDASAALLEAIQSGTLGSGRSAPLIGSYSTKYYGTGDVNQAMHELLYTLRRANLEFS